MKNILFEPKPMINVLIGMSVLMFVSMFTHPKIASIGLSLWILNIGWIVYLLVRGRMPELANHHEKQVGEARENKQYFKYTIYLLAFPMCAVGLFFVVVQLVMMFNL